MMIVCPQRRMAVLPLLGGNDAWLKQAPDPTNLATGSIKSVSHDPSGRGLWFEFEIG
jgi:hypothetical protein